MTHWQQLSRQEKINHVRDLLSDMAGDQERFTMNSYDANRPPGMPGSGVIVKLFGRSWADVAMACGFTPGYISTKPRAPIPQTCECGKPVAAAVKVTVRTSSGGSMRETLRLCRECKALHDENERYLRENGIRS